MTQDIRAMLVDEAGEEWEHEMMRTNMKLNMRS